MDERLPIDGRRATQKTYSHLAGQRRMPTEYEIVTSQLHYYTHLGFEVRTPVGEWHRQHQASPFGCSDWEQFRDPRETTYASYTALQSRREAFVDTLLQSMEDQRYDEQLSPVSLDRLERFVPVLRYPVHGLQMLAAHVAHLAPGGRVTVCGALQAADEVRRLQRFAYRMAQLRLTRTSFGDTSKDAWQRDPLWQPLRECVERLLVTFDWGEAFAALNLCLKPAFDTLFMVELPLAARADGDYLWREFSASLDEDCRWHRAWTKVLVRTALQDRPENRAVLQGWIDQWGPKVHRALTPLANSVGADVAGRVQLFTDGWLRELTLEPPR